MDMDSIETFFEALMKVWNEEPETMIELGLTDKVYLAIEQYVTGLDMNMPEKTEWSTTELQEDFTVLGFGHGYCAVKRKSDAVVGSFDFGGSPRKYFNFKPTN